jgi:tetratricopeptide (TPR) repeat protein
MIRKSYVLLPALFVGAFLSQAAGAQSGTEAAAKAQAGPSTEQESIYSIGTEMMDEQRWSDAVTDFDQLAAGKGQLVDASLYWKAYSLDKLGRRDEAIATCDKLSKQLPTSPWNRECLVLRTRSVVDAAQLADLARQTAKLNIGMAPLNTGMAPLIGTVNTEASSIYALEGAFSDIDGQRLDLYSKRPASEDDIKILALNSLMRQDPAKAMPMLRDFLKSDKPAAVREQALFVLSRSKDPQAQALLMEMATAKGDPEMQRAAVQTLALSRGKDAGATLEEVYRESSDAGVKRAAVNGLFLTHDAARLVELARGEKDLNMKRDIVAQLSLMNDKAATDYMVELLK